MEERDRVREIEEQIEAAQARMLTIQKEGKAIPAHVFREYLYYLDHLAESLKLLFQNINCMEKDLESVQQALIHASQNRKIIVKLKEKASQSHMMMVDRAEEKFLDEITMMRSNARS